MNQERANRLITIAVLKKKVAELEAAEKAAAFEESDPGDRKYGKVGEGKHAVKIGTVSVTDPTASYRVVDAAAWKGWVREHHPEQIQTIEAVHAAFEKEMLAAGCDDNGEMLPGVDLVQGSPTITVRTEAHAEDAIAAHLADAGLSWGLALDQIKGIEQ